MTFPRCEILKFNASDIVATSLDEIQSKPGTDVELDKDAFLPNTNQNQN